MTEAAPETTFPAGQAITPPPAGTAWRFVRQRMRNGTMTLSLTLAAEPIPRGASEPTAPAGTAWRVVKRGGVRIYIATPHPFLRSFD